MTEKQVNTLIKFGMVAAGLIACYFILKKFGIFKSSIEKEGERNIADMTSAAELAEIKGRATQSEAELRSIAAAIKNSWGFLNDDEEKIYNAFSRIQTYDDLMLVIRYYGVYGRKNEGLEDSISSRMSSREVSKINQILQDNGINFTF